ncbi:Mov34/MPN/PAD-1 family protein [Rubrivirga sp.]|uniref:Mov34/MPN/PAD-1 family protein n=1 Tax=Rubrivirga sp. TaxID=1885344 RepID=UPI003C743CA9
MVLAEDSDRRYPLRRLDLAYLRALVVDARLGGHFIPLPSGVRSAHGCHDVSGRIPHESVAVHGATAAGAVRAALDSPRSLVSVWRRLGDGSVARVPIRIGDVSEGAVGDWTIILSIDLFKEIHDQRAQRLPRETGGVLLGTIDLVCRDIAVVAHVPSPPDSEEWPTAYIRGVEGLPETLAWVGAATGGQVSYVGEWHSHPPGVPPRPSADDSSLFEWLADHRAQDGLPALMLIAADGDHSATYVASTTETPLDVVLASDIPDS